MNSRHRFGLCALLLILPGLPATADSEDTRLGDDPRPLLQTIHLTLDPRQSDYRGSVEIQLAVFEETDRFRFHSVGHELQRVTLSGSSGELVIEHERTGEDRVEVRSETVLTQGSYRLAIDFKATFAAPLEGLYTVERDGASYAFTVFQPVAARRAFPCLDEPELKIPFQVSLTVPEENQGISNSRVEHVSLADGWRTLRFRKTPPLPSYGVSVAVGPFEVLPIEGLGVPGRLITARGKSHLGAMAAAGTKQLLSALEQYFGRSYPYEKLDLLAVPGFPNGGLENPAAVIFSEDVLLLDPSAPVNRRRNHAVILAHELSHMWFGNLVTLKWWDDVWLNESFATWMAYKIVDEVFPELRVDAVRQRRTQNAFELDAQTTAPPIRREFDSPQEAFTVSAPLTYEKGSQVLAMIENWVGAEVFRSGVNAYLERHAWGNAEAADFWRAIDKSSGRSVAAALAAFIDQPGFPILDVELGDGKLKIQQQRFANHGKSAAPLSWNVPVAVKLISGANTRTESFFVTSRTAGPESETQTAASEGFELPEGSEPELVFPNAAVSGYYRWRLPIEQLRALAGAASRVLTASERLDLINNVGALLAAGQLAGGDYFDILGAMAGDPDPMVVSAVIDALSRTQPALVSRESEARYAAYLQEVFAPAWQRVGLEPISEETEMAAQLRSELYLMLGRDGRNEKLRLQAREAVASFLLAAEEGATDPDGNSALMPSALQLAALGGDKKLFVAYRERLLASKNPGDRRNLIVGLGWFRDASLRLSALDSFVTGDIDPGELLTLAFTLLQDTGGGDVLLGWLIENHDAVAAQLPPFLRSFLPRFAGGCSSERLARAEVFFAEEKIRVPGTERQMAQVSEQVRDCVGLREREGAAVTEFLHR